MFKRRNGAGLWRAVSATVLTAAQIDRPATAEPTIEAASALTLVTGATPPFSGAPGERGFLTLPAGDAFSRIGIRNTMADARRAVPIDTPDVALLRHRPPATALQTADQR